MRNSATITADNAVFIYGAIYEQSTVDFTVNPGFSVFSLFLTQTDLITTTPGVRPTQAFCVSDQIQHTVDGAGVTAAVPTHYGLGFSPRLRATTAGDSVTVTDTTAVNVAPSFSTAAGTFATWTNIRGVHMRNPTVGLFQPGAGIEAMGAYVAVDMDNITFGGNVTKIALRSALAAASNARFLLNNSTAASDFGSSVVHLNDNSGVIQFGGAVNAADVSLFWNNTTGDFDIFFWATSDRMKWSSPAANRFLFDTDGGNTVAEYNWNCHKFSLGAQTGAVGNQVGVFVAGTRSVAVGGEWSDFLLTQAGNITVNAAMGLVAGWTINAPSITLGTGSVTTGCGLNIGGNPNQGTNRVGVRIISNPTGGGGVNAALWVTAGRSQFDGFIDINKPVALGAGAAATLGLIGGSGPTAAAQAQWVEIEVNGVRHWLAAWT
jgi:hypothetical protein